MAARFHEVLLAACCALVVTGCRNAAPPPADPSYRDAESKLQTGDLAGALAISERGLRAFSERDPTEYWRFLLLQAEALEWQGRNPEALGLMAPEPPPSAGARVAARRATLQALAARSMQQYEKAEAYLKTAQSFAVGDPDVAIDIALADGWLGLSQNQLDRASHAFELALDRTRREQQPFREVNARGGLGLVEMTRHRFAAAVDWFQSALSIARAIQARVSIAKLLGNLGWSYVSIGEIDRALELYTEARDESLKLDALKDVGIWLTNIADIRASRQDFASADADYRRALEIARKLEDKRQIAIILRNLALVMIGQNDPGRATEYNDESLQLARATQDRNGEMAALVSSGSIAVSEHRARDAERLFRQVIDAERLADADANLALRAKAEAGLAGMYAAAGDVPRAGAFFHDALRTMGLARAALDRDEFKLSTITLARSIYDDYIDFLMTRGKVADACAVAETARAQTLKEGLGLARATGDGVADGRGCQLPASGVVLAYWLARERGYVWILRPVELTFVVLPREEQIAALVDRHTRALMGPLDTLQSANAAGTELYRLLASPAGQWIARDPHVTIIPDGVLCGLNFETLVVPDPQAHFWIEDVTVTQAGALALSSTRRLPRQPAAARPPTLLLVGNPLPVSDAYPALAHASEEIDGVSRHFDAGDRTVLVGASATPTAYANAKPGQYTFIHFVAHGVASRASPLDSVIVLSENGHPAYVYARDIVRTPLTATLVTISACDSAGARTYSGEGLVGLSWAFLRAGAHEVVGALWQVDDASTAQLMGALYDKIGAGQAPADAIREAKLRMLRSGSIYRKPLYWAAFVLYSGL